MAKTSLFWDVGIAVSWVLVRKCAKMILFETQDIAFRRWNMASPLPPLLALLVRQERGAFWNYEGDDRHIVAALAHVEGRGEPCPYEFSPYG